MTRKRVNSILLIVVAVLLLTVSIGYSALSKTLYISGSMNYTHNLSANDLCYDNTSIAVNCHDVQCMIDCLEKPSLCPSLPTFKVTSLNRNQENVERYFYYETGMTFDQWISSQYNTDRFYIEALGVYDYLAGAYLRNNSGSIILASATISSSINYTSSYQDCCFDPETLIQTDLEGHTKKIKDFEVGDTVVVQSSITGERYVTTVLKEAHEHPNTYDFGEVILENGTTLRFNTYHPIYTIDGFKTLTKFKDLPKLTDKDIVLLEDGNQIPIKEIKRYNVEKAEMTYNLLIKGINEYFLEDEYGYFANGVLVHHGIEEYDDEAHYRLKHQDRCINKNLYKDYDFDAASDEEIILFLAKLNFENEDAYKEYIKYYITPEQYIRYATFAKKVKVKTEELKKEDMKLNQNGINHYKNFKAKNNH